MTRLHVQYKSSLGARFAHTLRGRPWRTWLIVLGVSAGAGGVALAPLTQRLASQWWPQHSVPSPPPPPAITVPAPPPPLKQLPGNEASASLTPLPLVLVGTQPGRNRREGLAFIGTNPENPQTYGVGALLSNGARLVAVYGTYVELQKGGHLIELHTGGVVKRGGRPLDDLEAVADLIEVGGAHKAVVLKPSIDHLSEVLRVAPAYDAGQLAGFVVAPGSRRAAFDAWGLKEGDVVTLVDGAAPVDAEQAAFMLAAINEGSAVAVTVRRNGASQRLVLDGATLHREQTHGAPDSRTPPAT